MDGDCDISPVAALMGDRGRARVLSALAGGRELPATLLAAEAGVSPSTASEHLARLVAGGLLRCERRGRNRYYRLAGGEVAAAVEALARLAPAEPVRSLRQANRAAALRFARTCYDHLAGRLGVELLQALLRTGALVPCEDGYRLTDRGRALLDELGVELPASRRALVRHCLDWSERRHHLAGAVGAGLLARMLELGWLERAPRTRVVRLTDRGLGALPARLGLSLPG